MPSPAAAASGGADSGDNRTPFSLCVEIKEPPSAAATSALMHDSEELSEGGSEEGDIEVGLPCMEDVSAERLWLWAPKVTEEDGHKEHARRAASGTGHDPEPESRFTLKRKMGSTGRALRCTSCLLYTSPSPRDRTRSRMPSSA